MAYNTVVQPVAMYAVTVLQSSRLVPVIHVARGAHGVGSVDA
jgi:hypothetical protein